MKVALISYKPDNYDPDELDDNGINSIKQGALITDLSDIDGALA